MIAQSLTARKTIEMSIMRVLLFMSIFTLWAGEAAFDLGQQPASPFENEDVALLRRRSLETVIDTRKPGTQDTGYNIGKSGSYFKKCYASKGKGKGSSVSKGSKASKCDGRITQLKLKWNGAGPVTIRPRTIGALTPIEVIKNGDVITIEWASRYSKYKNDQYIDIYEGERKIGQSVFHISCSDDGMDMDDCGNPQGNGKNNGSEYVNDWILVGFTSSDGSTLNCSSSTTSSNRYTSGEGQGGAGFYEEEECSCYDCEGDDKICIDGYCLPCGEHTQYCCAASPPNNGCKGDLVCDKNVYDGLYGAVGKCVKECLVPPIPDTIPTCECDKATKSPHCPCSKTPTPPECPSNCGAEGESCCNGLCDNALTCKDGICVKDCAPLGTSCGIFGNNDACGCCDYKNDSSITDNVQCFDNTCCLSKPGDVGCGDGSPSGDNLKCCGNLECNKNTCCVPRGSTGCSLDGDCCSENNKCEKGTCCNDAIAGPCGGNDEACCGRRTCSALGTITDITDDKCCGLVGETDCQDNHDLCCGDLLCGLDVLDANGELGSDGKRDKCCVASGFTGCNIGNPPGENQCCDPNDFCNEDGKCVQCLQPTDTGCIAGDDSSCCGKDLVCEAGAGDGANFSENKCRVALGGDGCNVGIPVYSEIVGEPSICLDADNGTTCQGGQCCLPTASDLSCGKNSDNPRTCCDKRASCFMDKCCFLRLGTICTGEEECCGNRGCDGRCCLKEYARCSDSKDCCNNGDGDAGLTCRMGRSGEVSESNQLCRPA